jgi:glycosyltransferase involved in cell wall biosynthesis
VETVSGSFEEPVAAALDKERILVFADGVSATQQISFLKPLLSAASTGELSLRMEKHSKSRGFFEKTIAAEDPTVLVLSRYTWPKGKQIAQMARDRNIVTIFHIDDDLLNVPMSLGEEKYLAYNAPERLAALRDNMESCDIVYASTPALGEALRANNISKPIISGSLYCSVDPSQIATPLPSTMPTIGYMGTGGHSEDLALVLPAIIAVMDEFPELRFETFGTISPPDLGRFSDRYVHHDPIGNYSAFVSKLCSLGWWIGLAPLVDNHFNRCKADTKWVEYSLAGMATVASNLPVYQRACADDAGILADDIVQWTNALRRLLRDADARTRQVAAAQRKLAEDYNNDTLRRQIFSVLDAARNRQNDPASKTRTFGVE